MTENIITIIFIEYVGGSDIFFGGGGAGAVGEKYSLHLQGVVRRPILCRV